MSRYEYNAVHVMTTGDAQRFIQELEVEYGLLGVSHTVDLIELVDGDEVYGTVRRLLNKIPGHASDERQEYCLDTAIDALHALLVETPEKLLELAELKPPRFVMDGDDSLTLLADTERGDIVMLRRNEMDGDEAAQAVCEYLRDRGLGKVALVISYKDNAGSFEYLRRLAEIRQKFMMGYEISYGALPSSPSELDYDFSVWLDGQVREGDVLEEEAQDVTHDDCVAAHGTLQVSIHLGAGYAMRAGYGDDSEYDAMMTKALALAAPHVDFLLRSYGHSLRGLESRVAQEFGRQAQEKHCRSQEHCQKLIERLILRLTSQQAAA